MYCILFQGLSNFFFSFKNFFSLLFLFIYFEFFFFLFFCFDFFFIFLNFIFLERGGGEEISPPRNTSG